MYKRKDVTSVSTKKTAFSFSRFVPWRRGGNGEKNTLYAAESRNCNCLDGTLRTGVTLKICKNANNKMLTYSIEPSAIQRIFCAREGQSDGTYASTYCFLTKDGAYYYSQRTATTYSPSAAKSPGSTFDVASFTDDKHGLYTLLFGKNGVTRTAGATYEEYDAQEIFRCGCVADDRAYAVGAYNDLVYSALLQPLDFTESIHEGGRIALPDYAGKAVAILPLGEKLYVFFEYGVTEIEPAGSGKDFKRKKFPYQGGKILRGSVGACMGKLYFMATDGVYELDGKIVRKKFKSLNLRAGDTTSACNFAAYEGGFFLRYYTSGRTWRTVFLDPAADSGYCTMNLYGISEADGKAVCAYESSIYAVTDDGIYQTGEKSFFNTETLDFGLQGRKLLKTLCLKGTGTVDLTVVCGEKRKSFGVYVDGVKTITPQMYGETFRLEIRLYKGATLQGLSGEIESF